MSFLKQKLKYIVFFFCVISQFDLSAQMLSPTYSVWQGFAFDKAEVVASREAEERFARFVLGLESVAPTQQCEQIEQLFLKTEKYGVTVRFLDLTEKYLYSPNSPYRNDEKCLLFFDVANKYGISTFVNSKHYQKIYSALQKNRIGRVASDFAYTTPQGVEGKMYDDKHNWLILFFNDPECDECRYVKNSLDRASDLLRTKDVGVLAIYIDENVEVWRKAVYPASWISVYAPEVSKKTIYDIKALPTLYLLDKKKNVILKDVMVEQLLYYLNIK